MPSPRLPRGPFGCIVADPPWSFNDRGSRATPKYPLMDLTHIASMPIAQRAADQAHLYLWTPDTHLPQALHVMKSWGFELKHQLIWVKRRMNEKTGLPATKPTMGMGHYFRKCHEVALFGTRGPLTVGSHALRSVFEAPRTRHSAKPEELQDMAEVMSPGPRLELFARRKRKGWECWGNEL